MRFVVDVNLSPRWVAFLERSGYQAVHWRDVGPIDCEDSAIMAWAAGNDSIVLTSDLDFGAILAACGSRQPSVVQIRAGNLSVERIGQAVIDGVNQARAALVDGALLTIDVGGARLRLLPLRFGE